MNIRFLKPVTPASDRISRITAVAWSPNSRRLAIADSHRMVQLFDETGEKKDKFATKAADAASSSSAAGAGSDKAAAPGAPAKPASSSAYVITGLVFSPDSTRLAVAQSDNILFVYKLGLEWGDKKSICNKFLNSNPVTAVCWPSEHPNDVVYATADGKIKLGNLRNNKAVTLFVAESYCTALACCGGDLSSSAASHFAGHSFVSAHVDGSIHRFTLEDPPVHVKLAHHPSPIHSISWGLSSVVVTSSTDRRLCVYHADSGQCEQTVDVGDSSGLVAFNTAGTSCAVALFDRMLIFNANPETSNFEVTVDRTVENMYAPSALSWKHDGSRLVVGTMTGSSDLYDCFVRRYRYKSRFEFTYVSPSQVIVKRLSNGARIVLKSHFGYEIVRVNIYREQYLIAHTSTTLLMGDLASCKLSEIPWNGSGNERFYFDNPMVCMIYNAGELTLVEYGRNDPLASCRTENMSPHLISVQISDTATNTAPNGTRVIAYLLDRQTIRVQDLLTGAIVATVAHDAKIDWLELNPRATKILFRDKRRQLHLFDIASVVRMTLLSYCTYVQWVPSADVVVAQNRSDLCVWYNIDAADRVTIVSIKGDVVDIERNNGVTEVIVDEGLNTVSYALDESLIEFGSAMESGNYTAAADILSSQQFSPEIEAMWYQLADACLRSKGGFLLIAERCYAALGDASRARFLRKVNSMAHDAAVEFHIPGLDYFGVRARLAMLEGDYPRAEAIFLEQSQVDDVVEMYASLHMFEESISVAETHLPGASDRREKYASWLLETRQEERAAEMRLREGKMQQAVSLFLAAGLPGRAASILLSTRSREQAEKVLSALLAAGLYERCGEIHETLLQQPERALDTYVRAKSFRRALEVAKRHVPQRVVELEERWGDSLVLDSRNFDAAIPHYIEAGASQKAMEASLGARQLAKAVQLLATMPPKVKESYAERIADTYDAVFDNPREAERFYLIAGKPARAVNMYTVRNDVDAAYRLASTYLSSDVAAEIYSRQASILESQGRFRDAERLYLRTGDVDVAISMYKRLHMYDDMLRLVGHHRKDLLAETHAHLGSELEKEGDYAEAERLYGSTHWKMAVNMWRSLGRWDDAYRVAKQHGGVGASQQVAFAWALSLSPASASAGSAGGGGGGGVGGEETAASAEDMKLLTKLGLVSEAVDFAMSTGNWTFAFRCSDRCGRRLEVHEKHAMALEDEGRFEEAEVEFIAANKPREAVDMYVHQQDWAAARRVAAAHCQGPDNNAVYEDVVSSQISTAMGRRDWPRAEALIVEAKRWELGVRMYLTDAGLPAEARRFAAQYGCMHLLPRGGGAAAAAAAGGGAGVDASLGATEEERIRNLLKMGESEEAVRLALSSNTLSASQVRDSVVAAAEYQMHVLKNHEGAAEFYARVEMYDEAASVMEASGDTALAARYRALAASTAPASRPAVAAGGKYVPSNSNNNNNSNSNNNNSTAALTMAPTAASGDKSGGSRSSNSSVAAATNPQIEAFARRNQWEEVLRLCVSSSETPAVQSYYALLAAEFYTSKQLLEKACRLLEGESFTVCESEDTAHHILFDILRPAIVSSAGSGMDPFAIVSKLAAALPEDATVQRWLEMARLLHTVALLSEAPSGKNDLELSMVARAWTSMLRYSHELPADWLFYHAGEACRQVGGSLEMQGQAFVLLNRLLDISEAIDESPGSMADQVLENADLAPAVAADVPFDFPIPEEHSVEEALREDVRSWVLAMSLDSKFNVASSSLSGSGSGSGGDGSGSNLPLRDCQSCGRRRNCFEGSLKCGQCEAVAPGCGLTGYPLSVGGGRVECGSCHIGVSRDAWNVLVATRRICPLCGTTAMPFY